MNKHSFKLRNLINGLVATVVMVSVSVPALANKTNKSNIKAVLNPQIQFLGVEENSALFAVNLENATPAKFELSIKDAEGEVIFREVYEASKFSKVFKLVNENSASSDGLTFQVKELANGTNHNFEVSTASSYVKEVAVTKI